MEDPHTQLSVYGIFYVLNDINYSYIYIQKMKKNEHIALKIIELGV